MLGCPPPPRYDRAGSYSDEPTTSSYLPGEAATALFNHHFGSDDPDLESNSQCSRAAGSEVPGPFA